MFNLYYNILSSSCILLYWQLACKRQPKKNTSGSRRCFKCELMINSSLQEHCKTTEHTVSVLFSHCCLINYLCVIYHAFYIFHLFINGKKKNEFIVIAKEFDIDNCLIRIAWRWVHQYYKLEDFHSVLGYMLLEYSSF